MIMKTRKFLALPLALLTMQASHLVLAQAAAELDITIRVMEEGETPEGFIRRLELPPLEAFVNGVATGDLSQPGVEAAAAGEAAVVGGIMADATISAAVEDIGGAATETVNNVIRETISIEGTTAVITQPNLVPATIVNVLDENLPLQGSLRDVIGGNTGGVGGVVDGLPGTGGVADGLPGVGGVLGGGTGSVLNLETTQTVDVLSELDTGADEIVNNLGDELGTLVPSTDNPVDGLLNGGTEGLNAFGGAALQSETLLEGAAGVNSPAEVISEEVIPELPDEDVLGPVSGGLGDLLP